MTSAWARYWTLDPEIDFLNHGSFGACPIEVLEVQAELRARLEREPVRFMVRELEAAFDAVRAALGPFVGAEPEDLVFVPNATTGVNTVLRSLELHAGDEVVATDHAYAACRNALDDMARRAGAQVVIAGVPFPLQSASQVTASVMACVTPRTRLALLDHVTSPTGLVMPLDEIVTELAGCGVDTLVDGAHAPGMLPVDLHALGATYYTANCHKWICAPKGAAFLWVRPDRQSSIRPLVVSHGATSTRTDRSRYRLEFDWIGTDDPTAILAVPAALRVMGAMTPGGWADVRARNRALVLEARRILCAALGIAAPAPEDMIGSLAALPLPPGRSSAHPSPIWTEPLQKELFDRFHIEVPVYVWPASPHRLVRVSAQLYNSIPQYERLAGALSSLLA